MFDNVCYLGDRVVCDWKKIESNIWMVRDGVFQFVIDCGRIELLCVEM